MLAKRFFYVCAGLFLLALAYGFGTRTAAAQVGGQLIGGFFGPDATAVVGGMIYAVPLNAYTGTDGPPATLPLPRAGNVLAARANAEIGATISEAWVLYDDGSIYEWRPGMGWQFIVSLFSLSPTGAPNSTLGRLKNTYRR